MEQLLKSHENNSKRNLQSMKNNISRLAQKLGTCRPEMLGNVDDNMQEIRSQLQMLLSIMENGAVKGNEFNLKSTQVMVRFSKKNSGTTSFAGCSKH